MRLERASAFPAARRLRRRVALAAAALLGTAALASGQIGPYPDPFDPLKVRRIELVMEPEDWDTIRFDQTLSIEVPALLSAEGETALLVGVRRKSALAIPSETDPQKVSFKIDVNQYVVGQEWHGLKKLSLENGDDFNVVSEGFAWYMNRLAKNFAGSSYDPGLAAWAQVSVNGQDLGVYLNVEQPDKVFLKNRGIWVPGETWLYKQDGVDLVELKFGDPAGSPTYNALCYSPFRAGSAPACPSPDDATFVSEIQSLIDVRAMMTMGAIAAFNGNPDALFSKGKNFFFIDSLNGGPRRLTPWDLDTSFQRLSTDVSIYRTAKGPGRVWQEEILNHPAFRPVFDQTLHGLLDGPLQEANLLAFLDQAQAVLTPALASDPYFTVGASFFDELRDWVVARTANVRSQLPPPTGGLPPSPALAPTPANGAEGTTLDPLLSWTAGASAESHQVYFGTNPVPGAAELQGTQAGTSFAPGPLAPGVTYTWRVDEVNEHGTTTGATWSFTTLAEPTPAPRGRTRSGISGR